jgi:uncharacterized repeat protein (TIGR03803 family)
MQVKFKTADRYRLVIGAAAVLAACGGPQPPIGAPATATATADVRRAWKLQGLFSFMGGHDDGENPVSGVVALKHPGAYPQVIGTTSEGGYSGVGTVYGLTKSGKSWTDQLLYQFSGGDGWEPMGIAVPKKLDKTTPAFVTSFRGGAHSDGTLVVLQPNTSGGWTSLSAYSFAGKPDGSAPMGPVIEDKSGNLYGTTCCGGADGFGTVYRVQHTASGYTESVLYSFQGGSDGDYPRGRLIDLDGVLYGTTVSGGSSREFGTVFKLTPSGSGYTESIVYAFEGAPDGAEPYAGLCEGPDGALYGTTLEGGAGEYGGTVFKLTSNDSGWTESVLWRFNSFDGDGESPWGSVTVDKHGVIYGTTVNGGYTQSGTSGGTFFTLTPKKGVYKEKLYDFVGSNGSGPESGPSADGRGNIYVATYAGGLHFDGVVAQAKGAEGNADCDPSSVTESE